MQYFKYILFFITITSNAQVEVRAEFINKTLLKSQHVIGFDNQDNLYEIKESALVKNTKPKALNYSDIQLGNITSANIFNPLKTNIFYKGFNVVTILDNRLNEIYKIDFNQISPFRNISFISTGNDNTLWLYNQDTQQLEVYDYKQNITRVKTLPISGEIIDLKSNYNSCWVLTKDHLISYNYFGSMTSKIKNDGYTSISETNENIILKKENSLFYLAESASEIIPLTLPKLLIKAFFATNEIVYIYDGEFLHQYLLKTN